MKQLHRENNDYTATNAKLTSDSTNYLLKVVGLEAGYSKNKPVISDLSLQIMPGEVIGIIGPNGAGKSTTLKAILGLIEQFKGEVILPPRQSGGYAYIPELPALYAELTLWEHLEVTGMAYGMDHGEFEQRANWLLRHFDMDQAKYSLPGGFSKGMRQKVMIMCAYLVQPALYLVDEPFNGLDPFAINELLEWFENEKARGAGLLLSTHVLDIAERVCDRLILIKNGHQVAEGNLQQLQQQAGMKNADLFTVFTRLIRR